MTLCDQYASPSLQISDQNDVHLRNYPDTAIQIQAIHDLSEYRASTQVAHVERLKDFQAGTDALKYRLTPSSPISEVSDDILLCIFQGLFTPPASRHSNASDVIPFSRVCKRWRSIITSTPKFWTKISFPQAYKPHSTRQLPDSLREYFAVRLGRTGVLPLTVECDNDNGLSLSSLRPLGTALARIESLELTHAYEGVDEISNSCSILPNLRRLSLNVHRPLLFDERPISINLPRHNVPRLTHFELNTKYPLEAITIPWAQLKTLKICLRDGGSFDPYSILGQLEKIEDIQLNFGSRSRHLPTGIVVRPNVTLPHLHTLTLEGNNKDDLSLWLLTQNDLPSLTRLSYSLPQGHRQLVQALNVPQLWSILVLRLDFFSFARSWGTPSAVQEVMSALRELKYLETFCCKVYDVHSADRILRCLSVCDTQRGWLLPSLGSLEITRAPFHAETLISLRELLESRVSSIYVPANERMALRNVFLSLEHESSAFGDEERESMRHEWKPLEYNDRTVSVRAEIQGGLPEILSKELMAFCS